MHTFATVSLMGMLVIVFFWFGDYSMLWQTKQRIEGYYYIDLRDIYFWFLSILPAILSHFATIWGHYYRGDTIFQQSISRVTQSGKNKKQTLSVWDRHDPWLGYTLKYWILVALSVLLNLAWFIQPLAYNVKKALEKEEPLAVWSAYIGYGSGYATMGACAMLLFLVLRRSMLHSLGFTYAELLPLHRWMGVALIFWSTVHTAGYMMHFIVEGEVAAEINFDGETRGPQNIVGFVAYAALLVLGLMSIPQIRRKFFTMFIWTHRVMTVFTFAGTLMHYPYMMTWYYVVPSMCLFMTDRIVPKLIQACALAPEMTCSLDKESDILTIIFVARDQSEPLKPYYPGDYISIHVPSLGTLYHPFTIASYWPEDPYSMTLYIRTFSQNKNSWTNKLALMCGENGKSVRVGAHVDGVFGDRNHDYLSSDVMVIFSAGAALTTFMPLLKAIAAQINSEDLKVGASNPIKVHLICTFRYESELYAYGDFMHQITHDPRFLSWLSVVIHVSRPKKSLIRSTDASTVASSSPKDAGAKQSLDSDNSSTNTRILPAEPVADIQVSKEARVISDPYSHRALPTYPDASSQSVSTIHALRDVITTAVLLVVPAAAYVGSRYVGWEGTWNGESRWCRTTEIYDQNMTNWCMWAYTMVPGSIHMLVAIVIGYLGLWTARYTNLLQAGRKPTDLEGQFDRMQAVLTEQSYVADGSIRFTPGRLNVEKSIQDLMAAQVGIKDPSKPATTTSVFVGGPDSFLDSVETCSRKAKWSVSFHRETWSP